MIYVKRLILEMKQNILVEEYTPWIQALTEKRIRVTVKERWDSGADPAIPEDILQWCTLYVTDSADCAALHLQQGEPVLVCLHEKNRDEEFSGVKYVCEELLQQEAEYLDQVFCRQRHIPWDILETERCLVRETMEADLDAFYAIYSHPSVTEYMEDLYEDREQERIYIQDYIHNVYEFYGFGIWTVCLKDSEQVIGRAGLSYREGFEDPELGFVTGVPWQKQGITKEVCSAILDYGRDILGFERVIAFVEPGNQVSRYLLASLGFEKEKQEMLDGKEHLLYVCDLTCHRGSGCLPGMDPAENG